MARGAFPWLGFILLIIVSLIAGDRHFVGWGVLFFGAYALWNMYQLGLVNRDLLKRLERLEQQVSGTGEPLTTQAPPWLPTAPAAGPVAPEPKASPVARPPLAPPPPPPAPPTPTDWEGLWRSIAGPLAWSGGGISASAEARIGAVWFSRIGALLMLIGAIVGYTLLENGWVQAVIGWAAGSGLIGLGWLGKRRGYGYWAQAVSGSGVGLLYLVTTAAATIFKPAVLSIPIAFALMVLITALGTILAVGYDSIALGLLGMVGGFATPFLLSTGNGSFQVLFTYVAILDLGLLGVAWFKRWSLYNYILFLATWLIYGAWRGASYTPANSGWALLFATLFFAIFAGVTVQYNLLHRAKSRYQDLGLVLVNGLVYFTSGLELITGQGLRAAFAFAMAALYLGLAYATRRRNGQDRMLQVILLGLFGIFLTVAFPVALNGPWVSIAWALEAACFIWAGFLANEPAARWGGLATFAMAAIRLMVWETYPDWFGATFPPMMLRAFTFIVSIAAFYLGVWAYRRFRGELPVLGALAGVANFLTLWYITLEITIAFDASKSAFIAGNELMAIAAAWGVYGLVLTLAERRVNHVWLRHAARAVVGAGLALILLGISIAPFHSSEAPWRWGGYASTIGVIWVMEYLFRQRQEDRGVNGALSLIATVVGLRVGAFEVVRWVDPLFKQPDILRISMALRDMRLSTQAFGTVALWGVYSLGVMAAGLRLRSVATRLLAAFLFGFTMLYAMGVGFVNLSAAPWLRALAFLLLVPGVYLTTWLVRRKGDPVGTRDLQVTEWLALAAAAFTLVWLSAEVGGARAFLMSAAWGIYGFIVLAAGFFLRHRRTRFLAIGIVGLTIVKIGVYDLWQLAVIWRIWIAVGIGAMMLVASLAYQRFAKVIMGDEQQKAQA